jgi:hypothetical protein
VPQLRLHYADAGVAESGVGGMRVMLLGLRRDERTEKTVLRRDWEGGGMRWRTRAKEGEQGRGAREIALSTVRDAGAGREGEDEWEYECVMPEEGLQAAREMRLDRYAECSAVTGELMWEVVEDITRMAAKTTVEEQESGGMCCVM